ncbi:MAG: CPBP family intramembrane metalloprotease [Myxococcales bacterium]|nr:CPBP family intramembrane metalloprotease [Myxococcales bacterium]USN51106.1 MAG: CPBP family intramembrane metalloprotease [Myxococcales bacterium]
MGLFLSFYLNLISNIFGTVLSLAVVMAELSLPFWALERAHIDPKSLNIYAYRIESIFDSLFSNKDAKLKPDWPKIVKELVFTFFLCLIIFIPYTAGYTGFQLFLAHSQDKELFFSLNWPPMLGKEILTQIFVVAFPEELFYRGFLQGALLKKWPNQKFLFALPYGKAIIITNLIFACGHLMGGFHTMRVLTFFPGLIFSWIVYKRGNLLSAIIFHAACNILGQILYASCYIR